MIFSMKIDEIKKDLFKKENIYLIALITTIFFFDRFSKKIIIDNYSDGTYFINNFISFDLIWNPGIGFGLLNFDSSFIYNLITILISIIILILIYTFIISNLTDKIIFAFIIGGALGNLYDRIFFNAVPDFIDLHYNNFHWFIFNVADIFITIGIITLLISSFLKKN